MIIVPIIVISILFFSIQNTEPESNVENLKVSKFSIENNGSNLKLHVITKQSIPEILSTQKSDTRSLGYGYLWVESYSENQEFVGVLINHHLIEDFEGNGWHSEFAKISKSANSDTDFCLDVNDIFSEIIISKNTISATIPAGEIDLTEIELKEVVVVETILTSSCPSSIGAILV
jgi:hypothetical protein